jgi:DNA ligase (NAD+)
VNRKENREDLRYVRFVSYQTARWNPSASEAGIIHWLKQQGFHTVEYHEARSRADIESFYNDYLQGYRDQWLYETDGLILTVDDNSLHSEIDSRWVVDHHHHYALAIKPPSASKKTRLKAVDWQVSRQGALIPVALFEPIELGGATLARASLHNRAFVESMALQLGDELLIERANDVIPYVKENLSSSMREGESFMSNLAPSHCPVCGSAVVEEGVHLKCSNLECPERKIQTVLYWVKESGMDQVAEATIRLLFDKKIIANVSDMYKIEASDLEGLDGFGDKKIYNFLTQLEKVRTMEAPALISKLGIPLVQMKALKKLGINSMEAFMAFEDETFVIGRNILAWKKNPDNMRFLQDLLSVVNVQDSKDIQTLGQICMTGKGPMGRKEIQKIIEDKGYEFSSSVTGSTTILLCENPDGGSSKLQKARKMGIQLVSYEDFLSE